MFLSIPRLKQAVLTKYTADPNSWQIKLMLRKDCLFMKGQGGVKEEQPANMVILRPLQTNFRSVFEYVFLIQT